MDDLEGFYSGKTVLVTGHTGFKGSWLAQILLEMGATVIGYSLDPTTDPSLYEALEIKGQITDHRQDIGDLPSLSQVMIDKKPDIVFHLAAQAIVRTSYDEPVQTFMTNALGTCNLLEAMRISACVKSAVLITTDKVYKNKEQRKGYVETDELGGHDPYSASKACAEIIIDSYVKSFFNIAHYKKTHSTLIASARAGNVVGGGDWSTDRLIPDIVRAVMENGQEVVLRNPLAIRPWQHVLEPLTGYLMLAKELYEGDISCVGPWNFAPRPANIITVEKMTKEAIRILRKGSYTVAKEEGMKHEANLLVLDSGKAQERLGWRPLLDIRQTLGMTFEWYRNYYDGANMQEITRRQIKEWLR